MEEVRSFLEFQASNARDDLDMIEAQFNDAEKRRDAAQSDLDTAQDDLQQARNDLERAEQDLSDAEQAVRDARADLRNADERLGQARDELERLNQLALTPGNTVGGFGFESLFGPTEGPIQLGINTTHPGGSVPLDPSAVSTPPVPLPAAGYLLLAGVGGLIASRKLRKSRAA